MTEFNPQELVDAAARIAQDQLSGMEREECVEMVRSFTDVMSQWQPNVKELSEEPVQLALACLTLSHLYQRAFCEAYSFTEKRLAAKEALQKAFGESV